MELQQQKNHVSALVAAYVTAKREVELADEERRRNESRRERAADAVIAAASAIAKALGEEERTFIVGDAIVAWNGHGLLAVTKATVVQP